jgi:hypothetical protein
MEFTEKHIASGTMSYPPIDAEDFADHPHASIYVCGDAECQEQAAEYIQAQVGHRGVLRPFAAARPSDPFAGIDAGTEWESTLPAVGKD